MSIDAAVRPRTGPELVGRVSALAAGFRARVPVTESGRSVPRESIDELLAAGVAHLMVPREHGGSDARVRDLVELTAAAAYGCPSTGWIAGLMADLPQVVGLFPAEGQRAVWGSGPDAVVACSVMPTGRAEEVPGGYRLTGRHAFASGVDNADWVFLGGMVPSAGGTAPKAFAVTSPVQQAWRDVHFAVSHVSVDKSDIFGRYGRIALGVEETNTRGFF